MGNLVSFLTLPKIEMICACNWLCACTCKFQSLVSITLVAILQPNFAVGELSVPIGRFVCRKYMMWAGMSQHPIFPPCVHLFGQMRSVEGMDLFGLHAFAKIIPTVERTFNLSLRKYRSSTLMLHPC